MNDDGQGQAADDDSKRRPDRIHVPGRGLDVRHPSTHVQQKRERVRGRTMLAEAQEVSEGKGEKLKELDDQDQDLNPIARHRSIPIRKPSLIDRMMVCVVRTKELLLLMVVASLSGDEVEVDREDEEKEGGLDRLGRGRLQGGHESRQAQDGRREEEEGKEMVGSGSIHALFGSGCVLVPQLLVEHGHQGDQGHPKGHLDLHRQIVDQHIDLLLLTHRLLSSLLCGYRVQFCVPKIDHKGRKEDE